MDNLEEYFISDEEEPQPKARKTRKINTAKTRAITKSNFSQVKINLYDEKYKEWISNKNSKIWNFFKKVSKNK